MRIGLTGNIGSGKSAVAELLQEAGISVINLDELGRALTLDPKAIARIKKLLGTKAIIQGKLNRPVMRQMIFSSTIKRKSLEKILHPLIWQEFLKLAEALETKGKSIILCEAALIYEAGIDKKLDKVIVVSANDQIRFDRLTVRDEMTSKDFKLISKSQMPQSKKLKLAHYIVDNSGSIEELRPQVNSLINCWRAEGLLTGL